MIGNKIEKGCPRIGKPNQVRVEEVLYFFVPEKARGLIGSTGMNGTLDQMEHDPANT
jgi:hypothetical protein